MNEYMQVLTAVDRTEEAERLGRPTCQGRTTNEAASG
jgi:hypothetical protein